MPIDTGSIVWSLPTSSIINISRSNNSLKLRTIIETVIESLRLRDHGLRGSMVQVAHQQVVYLRISLQILDLQ